MGARSFHGQQTFDDSDLELISWISVISSASRGVRRRSQLHGAGQFPAGVGLGLGRGQVQLLG